MAELGAFFGNPNVQRQGARARALAGQRDVNTLADPRTYAIVQGLLGTAPDQMGFSVLNPDYEKIKKAAEPAFALGLLGQAAPLLAPLTKGLPVGASVKNVGNDLLSYRGSHTAPDRDFGAPLHDLTGGGQMYPADIYSSKAAQIYGGGMPYDQKAFSIAQQFKDKPNAFVTIYRAVPKDISNSEKLATLEKQMAAYMKRGTLPKDAENYSNGSKWYDAAFDRREALRKMPDEPSNEVNKINAGDWVTLTREYAKDHGESALNGEYKIISQKVKAKDVFTNADSIHEFGYQPQMAKPSQMEAPRQEALDTAQRNAALPIEAGGLGLPKNNTAMDRAKAMGFDTDTLHGSPNPNIEAFDPMMAGGNTGNAFDNNIFATTSPESAGGYALNWKHYRNTVKTSPEFRAIAREENSLLSKIGDLREAGDTKGVADVRSRLDELTQQKTNIYNDFMAGKLGSEGSTIYPLMARSEDFLPYEAEGANWMRANRPAIDAAEQAGYSGALIRNVKDNAGANLGTIADVLATSDPSRLRSRFAAFDPMRRNEPDILAGVLPLGLLADEEQRKKLYELMPSLLGE
jgi:hypothetical protein